jgi:hypothetical protein
MAAAELYAPKHERAAIVAALKSEERAALKSLRERRQLETAQKRKHRLVWGIAARKVTHEAKDSNPCRPYRRIRRRRKRDRQHG